MKPIEIYRELPDRRALVWGEFKDLPIGGDVFVVDGRGVEYAAVVECRVTGGAVVKVNEVLAD